MRVLLTMCGRNLTPDLCKWPVPAKHNRQMRQNRKLLSERTLVGRQLESLLCDGDHRMSCKPVELTGTPPNNGMQLTKLVNLSKIMGDQASLPLPNLLVGEAIDGLFVDSSRGHRRTRVLHHVPADERVYS